MRTDKTTIITSEVLNSLEKACNIKELVTEQEFIDVLKLDKAIIYMLVDWSGPERISRYLVYQVLTDLGPEEGIPVFKIDCSDQTKEYIVRWLVKQRESNKELYYGGWGETLFLNLGNIVDFIGNPAKNGRMKTEEKLAEWKKSE
ncbi:hypothetical protein A4D02_06615 [Niastella koreensis]|uniref:Uncharacterized protein n=2 Tax=Niastella koreensis TaxID=354356 RepID=G8TH60_NIAKG|nr:hypothetical protein [Niastella koreensis]AEW01670.1 hypothetical protein Niako_5434 [Niastella koreensis GR20-10]OQP48383.1 hypothetical protein A4D02_06615 [Niastella koreensis]